MPAFGGSVSNGWEAVRDAFVDNLENSEEVGAAVSVYHRGNKVVDLWGGSFDAEKTQPYVEDTLQLVFSTTKGITAIAVAMCVERGLLSYDEKVSTYWPEFAQHGKGDATVAQLLSHQCGLYTVDGDISLAEALDWTTITERLAGTAPRWEIGTKHGYHALTYGWLAGELVRRVDPTHRSLGAFVQQEIAILTDSAPGLLNTLDELAAALGDDANYAATITTALAGKVPSATTISQKTASYTLASINEKDSMIEMNAAGATTVTVPTDAAVAFPVGTSLDILRVGAGAVDVAAAGGVTVNATPGLKLRSQWSSATLIKRAANTWVLVGDLSA